MANVHRYNTRKWYYLWGPKSYSHTLILKPKVCKLVTYKVLRAVGEGSGQSPRSPGKALRVLGQKVMSGRRSQTSWESPPPWDFTFSPLKRCRVFLLGYSWRGPVLTPIAYPVPRSQSTSPSFLVLGSLISPLMAPHSSTLAWKIPRTEGLVGCSPWGR